MFNTPLGSNRLPMSATMRLVVAGVMATAFTGLSPLSAGDLSYVPPIRFLTEVPKVKDAVPVFKLTRTSAPTEFVNEHLQKVSAPALQLKANQHVSLLAERNVVRAYVDAETGDAAMIPDLQRIIGNEKGMPALSQEQAQEIVTSEFSDTRFIPKDDTELKIMEKIDIHGGSVSKATKAVVDPEAVRFSIVPAMRFADGVPVYGIGSHAAISLANDGTIEGLQRTWQTATKYQTVACKVKGQAVLDAIEKQLVGFRTRDAQITVDSITRAYYDGNAMYLTPVYYFTATLKPVNGKTVNDHVYGFVPIGDTFESIPDLSKMNSDAEQETQNSLSPKSPTILKKEADLKLDSVQLGLLGTGSTPIKVGLYANRDGALLSMATDFWYGLSSRSGFSLAQYYWAYPWEVDGTYSRYYMNAVNVAYTQPHGDWHLNTTYSNYADIWTIEAINPGFGAATGGCLATWVIDSCAVVPSMLDYQITTGNGYHAFDAWWNVFKGLHNVIGFRTEMWLNDGMNNGYGKALASGADVNGAWFQAIAANPAYAYNDGNKYYDNRHLHQYVHMGRASTFIDARDLGQSIYHIEPQSASGRLWNFWMGN